MPQELLGDICRTGDVSGRARRHLSVVPLSIAAHALAGAAILIIPLAAEVELPDPIRPSIQMAEIMTVLPPEPPALRRPAPNVRPVAAPTEAPPRIDDEPEQVPTGPPGPPVAGALPIASGPPGAFGGGGSAVALPPPPPRPPPEPEVIRRPGGNIREPRKVFDVPPVYPPIAQQARVEGTVILEAVIDESGAVSRLRVLRSQPLLDNAAIVAVRRWRYTPTLLNNVPVPILMTITVRFTLRQ
jgi:protein TonB